MVVRRFTVTEQFAGVRTGAPCMITSGAYAGHAALFVRIHEEVGNVEIEVDVRIVPGSHPLHDLEGPDDYQRIVVHPSGLVVAPELNSYDGIERDPHTGVAVGGVLNGVADSDPDEPLDVDPLGGRYYYVDETGHQWSALTGGPPPETETGVVAALRPGAVSHETASPGAPSRPDTASVSDAAPCDGADRTWNSDPSWNTPRDGVARSSGNTGSSWNTPRDGVAPSRWNDHDWGSPGSAQTLANRRARADPTRSWSAAAVPRGGALARVPIVEGVAALAISDESSPQEHREK
eukprot:scaffold5784_cov102-Attheya_sp.AAC.1